LSLELDDALQTIHYAQQAIERHPMPQIFASLGVAYIRLDQDSRAEETWKRGITLFPHHPRCYQLYAELLAAQGDFSSALHHARQATTLAGEHNPEFLITLANIEEDSGNLTAAHEIYTHLVTLASSTQNYYFLAANKVKQQQDQEAIQILTDVLRQELQELDIEDEKQSYIATYFARFSQDWNNMQSAVNILLAAANSLPHYMHTDAHALIHRVSIGLMGIHTKYKEVLSSKLTTYENFLLTMHYSPEYSREEIYAAHCSFNELFALPVAPGKSSYQTLNTPEKRLRIGYISQDFRTHSVAYFIEPILATHNPEHVEIFCYYNNKHEDTVSERFKHYCSGGWRHCFDWSDDTLVNTIRDDKIDILVDLMGHTGLNRILIFARKPAPIQISYLGYPDTTGLTAIDYRLTDAWAEPAGAERFSSERLLRMPESYFCYRPADITEKITVNALPALQTHTITFGSFNLYLKITDAQIQTWAHILTQVPDSRLLLKVRLYGDILRNFKTIITQRFAHFGIPRERLIIRDFTRSLEVALKIYHEVDICLDTYPYSGATTTCESLWMGCPVISRYGENHVSRMSLSILNAAGMGEWAVPDEASYINTAVTLAQDLDKLAHFRATLRQRLRDSSLMDAATFTQHLEHHYRNIWREYCPISAFPFDIRKKTAQ
jgi:protein O-GlcNAc transferase